MSAVSAVDNSRQLCPGRYHKQLSWLSSPDARYLERILRRRVELRRAAPILFHRDRLDAFRRSDMTDAVEDHGETGDDEEMRRNDDEVEDDAAADLEAGDSRDDAQDRTPAEHRQGIAPHGVDRRARRDFLEQRP